MISSSNIPKMFFTKNSMKLLPLLKNKQIYLNLSYRSISGINAWDQELTTEIKHKIEDHWSKKFASGPTINYNESEINKKPKYYVLSMFPYPSGKLHMGHVRVYTISDSIARYQRMNGKNVIHPIGWDAFGLPAENAAIANKTSPSTWTVNNIKHMKDQLKHLGCSFEWDRELATCDPRYYKWTQALFSKLFEAGLAYQKEALVNWDSVDCTVLADEQVDENGYSWRSGVKVEKKLLRQWFIKTTKFAKALQDGLDDSILQDWRDIIKLQKHWIGECNGIAVDFSIKSSLNEKLTLWTDRPEYLESVAFIAVKSSNLLAKNSKNCKTLDENTKLLDLIAINPITKEELKIYVTNCEGIESGSIDYAEGTDCHMGIPEINENDQLFCKKYKIPLRNATPKTQKEIIKKLSELNAGGYFISSKLRDWLISRQRFWGTPIPIIHCKSCGAVPVPKKDLPVQLPECNEVSGVGSVLASNENWKNVHCPKCGQPAERETDTMDTFVDSSWYFLRYLDRNCEDEMFNVEKAKKMAPVDLYIGGKEHAVLHLYYARFISHFLHSLGMLPEREPFKRLLVQGMVMGRSYRIKGSGKYLPADQVNVINLKKNKATCKETNEPVVMQWEKMSKSKHNGTDPTDMFNEYGVDTTRLLILADVAPTSHRNWNSNTFPGVINWQRRLWLTIQDFIKHRTEMPAITKQDEFHANEDYLFDSRNYYVKGATFNYCDSQQISVAISKLQGLTNSIRKAPSFVFARSLQFERALACQIILLAPMAPHFASELWTGFLSAPNRLSENHEIQWDKDVLEQNWPEVDYDYNLDLVCQVNGCENAVLKMPRKDLEVLPKDVAVNMALSQSKVQEVLATRKVLDVNFVMHKGYEGVVNFITTDPPPKILHEKTENLSENIKDTVNN